MSLHDSLQMSQELPSPRFWLSEFIDRFVHAVWPPLAPSVKKMAVQIEPPPNSQLTPPSDPNRSMVAWLAVHSYQEAQGRPIC